MYIVKKGFSGKVSGNKNQVLDIKDKKIIKDLMNAGYIEEYSEKNQSNTELKKENESLKKTIQNLEEEIVLLKEKLAEPDDKNEKELNSEETGDKESQTNK